MPLTLGRSRRLQRKSPRLPKTPSRLEAMSGTFHASVLAAQAGFLFLHIRLPASDPQEHPVDASGIRVMAAEEIRCAKALPISTR